MIYETLKINNLEDIYLNVGNNKTTPNSVINIIDKDKKIVVPKTVKIPSKNIEADIIVSGIDKVKVNLANCCNPIFGDEIIGYITKGNGISVHRRHCHNIEMLENRIISVDWNENNTTDKRYYTLIVIYTNINTNNIAEVVQKTSVLNINIDSVKIDNRQDEMIYELGIYVKGIEQLDRLILELNKVSYIYKIERLMR